MAKKRSIERRQNLEHIMEETSMKHATDSKLEEVLATAERLNAKEVWASDTRNADAKLAELTEQRANARHFHVLGNQRQTYEPTNKAACAICNPDTEGC